MQGGLLGLMAIGDQPAQEVDEEIVGAAVAGMLNLADILEFIVDALDDRPLAQEQFVEIRQGLGAHVLATFGDEDEALSDQELLGQGCGDIAAVAKELAEEAAHQPRHRAAVVEVARRQTERQHLAAVIDDQMQFEAVEPADRGLAAARIHSEDAMLRDARGVAHLQAGRIDEADAGTLAELRVQIDRQRQQDTRHERDKARIADELGELGAQLGLDVLRVEALKGAVARLLEEDQDRHDLAGTQAGGALAAPQTGAQPLPFPPRLKLLPERIHRAIQVEYTHGDTSSRGTDGSW
jgi:hypothetical protein